MPTKQRHCAYCCCSFMINHCWMWWPSQVPKFYSIFHVCAWPPWHTTLKVIFICRTVCTVDRRRCLMSYEMLKSLIQLLRISTSSIAVYLVILRVCDETHLILTSCHGCAVESKSRQWPNRMCTLYVIIYHSSASAAIRQRAFFPHTQPIIFVIKWLINSKKTVYNYPAIWLFQDPELFFYSKTNKVVVAVLFVTKRTISAVCIEQIYWCGAGHFVDTARDKP